MNLNIQIIWAFFIAAMVLAAVGLGLLASMIIGQRRFINAERRRIREQRIAELRFKNLFNSVSDIIYEHTSDGTIRLLNEAVHTHFGVEPGELIGVNLRDVLPARARMGFDAYMQRIGERGRDHGIVRLRSGSGRWLFLEYESSRRDQNDGMCEVRGICRNVTERIEADRIHKKNERRFRRFVSASRVPTIIERMGTVLYANAAAATLFGVASPSELIGESLVSSFLRAEDPEQQKQLVHLLTSHERTPILDSRLKRPAGDVRDVAISAVPVLFEGSIASHVVFDDITDRIKTARALADEKERLAVTLQSIHDGVIATDLDGRIVLMSRSAEEMTGIHGDRAQGTHIEDICMLRDVENMHEITGYFDRIVRHRGVSGDTNEVYLVSHDGSKRLISADGVPIVNRSGEEVGVVLAFHDITERKRFENELFRSAKMESIAVLAGGLAHDFNNILASIIGSITVAKELLKAQKEAAGILDEAKQGVLRARDLTRQLITISSGDSPVRQTADITEVINESVNLTLRGTNVKARMELADDLMSVRADVSQLSQVFTNLLLNAVQAMPMGGGIRIRASNLIAGEIVPETFEKGPYIRIEIKDTGVGIPAEHIEHIFEPFYTTKDRGTGLGLASVYSIVKGHGGSIDVHSQPGRGTEFILLLPATKDKAIRERESSSTGTISGDMRALVIDDDQAVLRSLSRMLSLIGSRVTLCATAARGISCFRDACDEGHPFDIVFLDLKIPGGPGGLDIIRTILEKDPRAKVVAISAHLYTMEYRNLDTLGFWAQLAKPFTLEELKQLVGAIRTGIHP